MLSHRFREFRHRIQSLFHRNQIDRDLDDELAFHLAQRAEKNRAGGMDAGEAGYAAHRQFGNVTRLKERTREVRILTSIENAWRDVRFSTRMLLKEPVFAFIVILTLALGIGANTAIFSIINGFTLRPLPIADPRSVVYLAFPHGPTNFDSEFSYPEFTDLQRQTSDVFADTAGIIFGGYAGFASSSDGLTYEGHTQALQTAFVTGNFFSMLGIRPELGRLILPDEGKSPGSDPVVIISDTYWRARFHAAPNIVGKPAAINGKPVTIVGVTPEGFEGVTPLVSMQAYLPLGMATLDSDGNTDFLIDRKSRTLNLIARWKNGMNEAKAQPALDIVGQRLFQQLGASGRFELTARNAASRPRDHQSAGLAAEAGEPFHDSFRARFVARMRQRCESRAGPRNWPRARDRRSHRAGRISHPHHPATPHREPATLFRRLPGGRDCRRPT